jgi:hypothetical protein
MIFLTFSWCNGFLSSFQMYPIPCQNANITIKIDRGNSNLNKSMVEILPTQHDFINKKVDTINSS